MARRSVAALQTMLLLLMILIQVRLISSSLIEYIPAIASSGGESRENLIKAYFKLGLAYNEIVSFLLLYHGIKLSVRQLKRFLSIYGLRRRNQHSQLSDVIDAIAQELRGSSNSLGYRAMHQKLRVDYGLVVARDTVRKVLKGLDPEGVACRSHKQFRRRQYTSKGPNFIWHIDGYDKLKPFGFCVHGGIDGYSRRIMWLEVGPSNNNPSITAQYFVDCIRQVNGFPTLVRGDCGTENVYIAAIQRYFRKARNNQCNENTCSGFLYGKSTANQRIEAWWAILRKSNTNWWMNYFKDMRDLGMFDNSDPLHVNCLQFCFMPIIQKELYQVAKLWNLHNIRRSKNSESPPGRPDVLYFLPERTQVLDYKCIVDPTNIRVAESVCGQQRPPFGCNASFAELARMLMLEHNLSEPKSANDAKDLYNLLLIYISQI